MKFYNSASLILTLIACALEQFTRAISSSSAGDHDECVFVGCQCQMMLPTNQLVRCGKGKHTEFPQRNSKKYHLAKQTHIELFHNNVTQVPAGHLRHLHITVLDLSYNKIERLHNESQM